MSDSIPSPIILQTKTVPLTQGKVAIVDVDDYDFLMQWKWYVNWDGFNWYARRNSRGSRRSRTTIRMHNAILGVDSGILVDHIDHNGLNNVRSNLRLCTNQENVRNSRRQRSSTSGYKGVSLYKPSGKYRARIGVGDETIYLGYYQTAEDAARAYDQAALRYFGQFAVLNFTE